eukprot:jgi/Ulvmu1/12221/UM086_0011.1
MESQSQSQSHRCSKIKSIVKHEVLHAHRVALELHGHWLVRCRRNSGWVRLLEVWAFIVLFSVMLTLQRSAAVSHRVFSSVTQAVNPIQSNLHNIADVYEYLQELVGSIFVGPTCGDGLCEGPCEMPSWSRFGCASDCGFLEDVLDVDSIQIDLQWDFAHCSSSMSPAMLISNARWNICPVAVASHGHECYFEEDQSFQSISGSVRLNIAALPIGTWELIVKRDYFRKISAAVRNSRKMEDAGRAFAKLRMAHQVAQVGVQYEDSLLVEALQWATMDLDDVVLRYVNAAASLLLDEAAAQSSNRSMFANQASYSQYVRDINFNAEAIIHNYNNRNIPACQSALQQLNQKNSTVIAGPDAIFIPGRLAWDAENTSAGVLRMNVTWPYDDDGVTCHDTDCECLRIASMINSAVKSQLEHMHTSLSSRVESVTVPQPIGRDSVMQAARHKLQLQLLTREPELFPFTTRLSPGSDPIADPMQSSVTELASLYFKGDMIYPLGPLVTSAADSLLDLHNLSMLRLNGADNISSIDMKLVSMARRVQSRRLELAEGWARTANRPEVMRALQEDPPEYNQVVRTGGNDFYKFCSLENRGLQQYQGTCLEAVQYTDNGIFSCGSGFFNETDCIRQVQMQMDCNALCECSDTATAAQSGSATGACTGYSDIPGLSTEYCSCAACMTLSAATETREWDILSQMRMSNRLNSHWTPSATRPAGTVRGLLSTDRMSTRVSSLSLIQDSLLQSASSAESSIRNASSAASQLGKASELEQLVSAASSSIHYKYTAHHAALSAITEEQAGITYALERQNVAAALIKLLDSSQDISIRRFEKGYTDVLNALQRVLTQDASSEAALLMLWGAARRRLLVESRNAAMAATPCTTVNGTVLHWESHQFESRTRKGFQNLLDVRARAIGAFANHILAGVHLHAKRVAPALCKTRFGDLASICHGHVSFLPYGIDPAFRTTAVSMYQDHLDNKATKTALYNCSDLPSQPRYNVSHRNPFLGTYETGNPEPYCADLYNHLHEPLAFQARRLAGFGDGFSVWVDMQNTESSAYKLMQYLREANFLDSMSQEFTAVINMFNPTLKVLAQTFVQFSWATSGLLNVRWSTDTLRACFYCSSTDIFRCCIEIPVFLTLLWAVIASCRRICMMGQIELVPILLNMWMASAMVVWWVHTGITSHQLFISTSYPVYKNIFSQGNMLKLTDPASTDGLWMAAQGTAMLKSLSFWRNLYFAVSSMYVMSLAASFLVNQMQFHPVLGIVSRSLRLAAEDLKNFFILLACLVFLYAVIGHSTFGAAVQKFSSMYLSFETCIHMLLGDMSISNELRMLVDPIRTIAALYCWSYMLLVFTVVLNFMLAIIVDAFVVHKSSENPYQAGMFEELSVFTKDTLSRITGRQQMSTYQLGTILACCKNISASLNTGSTSSLLISKRQVHSSNILELLTRAESCSTNCSQGAHHKGKNLESVADVLKEHMHPGMSTSCSPT